MNAPRPDELAPVLIRRYPNRRLYDTEASRYVGLDELAALLREGRALRVVDARSGDDLTQPTLAQVLLEARGAARWLAEDALQHLLRLDDRALASALARGLAHAALEPEPTAAPDPVLVRSPAPAPAPHQALASHHALASPQPEPAPPAPAAHPTPAASPYPPPEAPQRFAYPLPLAPAPAPAAPASQSTALAAEVAQLRAELEQLRGLVAHALTPRGGR